MVKPVVYVLAGVNGAGKSSVGGSLLAQQGMSWYNPDTFARELMRAVTELDQETANGIAWNEGLRRLRSAVDRKSNFAFETTLGGSTVTKDLIAAAATHDVVIWFCGLETPELHIQRVESRVAAGGHNIPERRIRERFITSRLNIIRLIPYAAEVRVFDNSTPANESGVVPDPILVLALQRGKMRYPAPRDLQALKRTPDWAKPLVQAAMDLSRSGKSKR
jgi:predicted ABC-type ATPase